MAKIDLLVLVIKGEKMNPVFIGGLIFVLTIIAIAISDNMKNNDIRSFIVFMIGVIVGGLIMIGSL